MAYITLSRKAFFHNLDIIASKTGGVEKIALVLKDNAYGHGLLEISQMAREYGVTKAVVRTLDEARRVERYFDTILMLDDTVDAVSETIHTTINSLEQIERIITGAKVQLKVDTGMHRNGICMEELETALAAIQARGLTCNAIFTHFRSADALSSELFWQQKQFEKVKAAAGTLGFMGDFHSCNSAALFRSSSFDESMVRVGIAAYGCLQLDGVYGVPDLQPVLSLWAERGATRSLHVNERIGYNATYEADSDRVVSTYDLGYADGLLRHASNRYVLPNGAKILGRISMDNCSITCKDDTVLMFDNANDFAEAAQTIGYEVLTSLKPNIERRIV